MATRFAVASTSWNTPSTWDNGAVPVAGDTVYPNGFTVTIDTDIDVASLNNNVSNVYLPNMAIPKMTSNTQPSGVVFATQNPTTAYYAFDQDSSSTNFWSSNIVNVGIIGYQFTSTKIIKQYRFTSLTNFTAKNWNLEGSLDGINYFTVHNVINNASTIYNSGVIPNTTAYLYYRMNITSTTNGNAPSFISFEMTESTVTSYGSVAGGSFTVPSSLSGTREITFSGDGIITGNTSLTSNVVTVAALTGNIVNFNVSGGGYIVNRFYRTLTLTNTTTPVINITGTATVNFNGDLWGSQTANNTYNASGVVGINAAATVNVFGNIYADKGTDGAPSYYAAILQMNATNCIVNVTGTVYASDYKAYGTPIVSTAVNTLNITGNVISNISYCIYTNSTAIYLTIVGNVTYTNASSWSPVNIFGASIVSITGSITAPPSFPAINCNTGAATINVPTGIITAGTNAVGISAPSATLVTIGNSPLINTNGLMAVYAGKIRLYSPANVQWVFQDNIASNKVLYSAGGSIGLPLTTDVRNNVTYGASNELTGTMIVPTNPNVRIGVPVDVSPNVGTADLTAEDLFNAIAVSPNPVAERLRNVSTIQTTGDQLAAF
jgi:hypothetical protein